MSKKETEKLGIEKLPLEELKVQRAPVNFEKLVQQTLTDNHCSKIELHGFEEIYDFFKDEFRGHEDELKAGINRLLRLPDGTHLYLPDQYRIDGVWVTVNRKCKEIVIFRN